MLSELVSMDQTDNIPNKISGGEFHDAEISGLTADSRRVKPGFLFAALEGSETDGRKFIPDAISRGAVAVLASSGTQLKGHQVSILTDSNPRRRYATLASNFYQPQPLHTAAVTGTNGKSSVVDFTRQIWTALGVKAASLGTLGVVAPDSGLELSSAASLTTPDPSDLHASLKSLADGGVDHVILEASSHGLDQYRLDGVKVTVAAYTNLSRDHLDYHGSLEQYFNAKLRLFSEIVGAGGVAVLNADDGHFEALRRTAELSRQRVVSYGREGEDITLLGLQASADGQILKLKLLGQKETVTLPLIGGFQAMNALCALGVVLAEDGDPAAAVAALAKLKGVRGRLELAARHASGAGVYVDYAHTPDALENVLKAMRPHVDRQLKVVFGCGGDRDRGKRPEMGAVAHQFADAIIVTDDNPRGEEAAAIRQDIIKACPGSIEIGDRTQAIAEAVAGLAAGDILVIAGKGHEQGQIIGDEVRPFDDVSVVRNVIEGAKT